MTTVVNIRIVMHASSFTRITSGFGAAAGEKDAESNSPPNLISVCVFHHRSIHAATIGVKGRAPSELEWRRPTLMEKVLRRNDGMRAEFGGELAREPGPVYAVNGRGRGSSSGVKMRHLTIQLRQTPVWQTFAKTESESKSNVPLASGTSRRAFVSVGDLLPAPAQAP